jgi:pimeloyl-ACP methyl ester carboxylesterase
VTALLAVVAALLGLLVVSALVLATFTARTARRVEAALPPLGRFVDVEGARMHYLEKGAGPPLVLIHGLAGQMRHFTYAMVDRLAADHRVIAIDRPGAGHSVRHAGASARLGVQAGSVAALMRALGVERAVLVGHSLGGAASLAVALAHPELVAGLALIAPLTQVEAEPPGVFARLAIASPLVRRLVSWTLATPLAIRGSARLLQVIFAPEPVPHDFATAGGGLLGLRPGAFFAASSDLVAVNDDLPGMVGRYDTLRLPVGILFGREDRLLRPAMHGERTAALGPHVRLELVDGGHMLPLTQPDRCAAFVRGVVARSGLAPAHAVS